jgi:hypothetical protein
LKNLRNLRDVGAGNGAARDGVGLMRLKIIQQTRLTRGLDGLQISQRKINVASINHALQVGYVIVKVKEVSVENRLYRWLIKRQHPR